MAAINVSPLPPVIIEAGAVKNVGATVKQLGGDSVFIITDANITAAGLTAKVTAALSDGITVEVFDQIMANPTATIINQGAAQLRAFAAGKTTIVITLGGGSPMDAGKAIATLARQQDDNIISFCFNPKFDEKRQSVDLKTFQPKTLATGAYKVIAIPTTSGTASETNGSAVVTDDLSPVHRKIIFDSPDAKAAQIILDPELCVGIPAYPTATCGMDVLTHSLEAFTSARNNPYSDAIALGAIKLVAQNLRATLADPTNVKLRQNMHLASHMAGVAFCISGLGIIHAMGHPLSAMYNQAHGQTLSTMMPVLMRFNMSKRADKYAQVAEAFGVYDPSKTATQNAERAIEAVTQLSNDVGTGRSIESYSNGNFEKDLDQMARQAMTDICMLSTPVKPTIDQVKELYRAAFRDEKMYTSVTKQASKL